MQQPPRTRALRILSLSRGSVPCEFATRLAVDAGFAVVKGELADGDPLRTRAGKLFAFLAAGKHSVVLLAADPGHSLDQLLAGCDAVVADEWGRDFLGSRAEAVPLIVVGERDGSALQGMGVERSDEFLAFHAAGLGFLTPRVMPGYPSAGPLCPNANLLEFLSGLYGAIALFALLAGHRGNAAASVNVARKASAGLTAAALPLLRREIAAVLYEGAKPHRSERIWKVSPAEVHRCQDGWLFVDVIEDVQWVRLCEYMDRPDLAADPNLATRDQRFAQADAICEVLDAFFAAKPKSCWMDAQARGIPVAPVNALADLVGDPQLAARGFWESIGDANGLPLTAPVTPLARLFAATARGDSLRAPGLGEHNDAWFGATDLPQSKHSERQPIAAGGAGAAPARRPLEGVRVLELTHVWSGPLCGQVLADLGAEVIRVESRAHLDIHRRGGPYPQGKAGVNRSGTWNAQNRNKLGCTIDLKSPEGKQLLLDLAARSDVVIENFTPGTLERLGFGFKALCQANPRMILLSLSGFGHSGPYRDSLAYGPMMDAATGLSAMTTYADGIPRAVNGWAADVGGALYGCAAVLVALSQAPREPRHLDISQFESGVMFVAEALLAAANPGSTQAPVVESAMLMTVATCDPERWIAVAARSPREQAALRAILTGVTGAGVTGQRGKQDQRAGEVPAQFEVLMSAWARQQTREQALAALEVAGVPAVPVSSVEELLADPRLQSLGAWLTVDHAECGPMRSYGPTIRLSDAAPPVRAAPLLGGDNARVFGDILGVLPERIKDLAGRNII